MFFFLSKTFWDGQLIDIEKLIEPYWDDLTSCFFQQL